MRSVRFRAVWRNPRFETAAPEEARHGEEERQPEDVNEPVDRHGPGALVPVGREQAGAWTGTSNSICRCSQRIHLVESRACASAFSWVSARATVAASRACRSMLARRSVTTSISPVPAASAAGRSARPARGRWGSPKRLAALPTSIPRGVPSRASNSSPSSDSACGRKPKMPPPSLLMTTMRTVAATSRRAASPPMSWRRPRSPVTIVVGVAAGVGGADARGDQTVDAVGAAVAEEGDVRLAGGEESLLVADRHARGGVDEVAVAVGLAEGMVERGLGDRAVGKDATRSPRARPARHRASAVAPDALPSPSASPSPPRARSGRRAVPRRRGWSARSSRRRGRSRSGRHRLPTARRAAACWSASRRSAGPGRARPSGRSARRAAVGRKWRRRRSGRGGRSGAVRWARRGSESPRPGRGGRAARAARGRAGDRRRSRRRSRRRCGRPSRRAGRPMARGRSMSLPSGVGHRGPPGPADQSRLRRPRPGSAPAARAKAG